MPKTGGGLVPAAELLMVGYGARQHIRKNALQHLHQEITITRKQGSFTLEESLARLVKDGVVDWRDAHARAGHVEDFEQLCPRPSASCGTRDQGSGIREVQGSRCGPDKSDPRLLSVNRIAFEPCATPSCAGSPVPIPGPLDRPPDPLLQLLAIAAAERQPRAVPQEHDVLAVEPGLQLLAPARC